MGHTSAISPPAPSDNKQMTTTDTRHPETSYSLVADMTDTSTAHISGIVEGTDMHIMIDTGSSISFINETTRMAIPSLRKRPLKSTFFLSKSVTGQNLEFYVLLSPLLHTISRQLEHSKSITMTAISAIQLISLMISYGLIFHVKAHTLSKMDWTIQGLEQIGFTHR